MRRFFTVLSLLLLCLPVLADRKKQVDPRDTLQYHYEYTQAGKKYLLGLNFYGEEARVYTYRVLRRSCVQVGEPFKVEALRDSVSFVNVAGTDYILFSYLHDGEEPGTLDWTLKAVSFNADRYEFVNFVGKPLPSEGERFRIEGMSGSGMRANTDALTDYLDSLLLADKRLVVLPESIYKTDKIVEWWLENNPQALSSAKKVQMASLPSDCSAVVAFEGSGDKIKSKSGRYLVASVDLRGYTLVIVKNQKQSSYTLVWAEPTGVRKADRRLVNLYFADDNTVAMLFYHGSSMLKYRISLGSGQLTRS